MSQHAGPPRRLQGSLLLGVVRHSLAERLLRLRPLDKSFPAGDPLAVAPPFLPVRLLRDRLPSLPERLPLSQERTSDNSDVAILRMEDTWRLLRGDGPQRGTGNEWKSRAVSTLQGLLIANKLHGTVRIQFYPSTCVSAFACL